MTGVALRVNDVSKRFGTIQALDRVSFDVPVGSIFGLLGPNGAGKTTLFSIGANFISADQGTVEVLGTDVRHISRLQGRLSILPQDALFQRNVPILEQLVFFRLLDGKTRSEAEAEARRTLERVGLGEYLKKGVHSLSHGMVKRLGVAQAFLGEPEVILLDEPTSGLDPQNARHIRDLVRELNEERATIVISSHNLAEVQELCEHVAILDHGKVVTYGPVAEITRSGHELELDLTRTLEPHEEERLRAIGGVGRFIDRGPTRYVATLELGDDQTDPHPIVKAILATLIELDVTPRRLKEGQTLEEHFLKVIRTAEAYGQDPNQA